MLPPATGVEAGDGLQQLPLAGAGNAGDAQDLAGVSGEAHVAEALDPQAVVDGQALHRQPQLHVHRLGAVDVQGDAVAHHHVCQGLLVGVPGHDVADVLSLAQHRHPVGDLQHLVELVGDDDEGLSVGLHVPHDLEEPVRLLGGQHGGGLVQDQDLGAPVEDLDDLHRLLLGDGHLVDLLIQIDLKTVFFADLGDPLAGRLQIHAARLLQAQDDVLRGGKDVHQLEVLVDHADPQVIGVLGGGDRDRPVVDVDLARVRVIDPGEHVHQGGLAAAVLPQQGQDLALVELQVDVVVGHHGAEALGDVLHSDGVLNSFQGCHPFFGGGRRMGWPPRGVGRCGKYPPLFYHKELWL